MNKYAVEVRKAPQQGGWQWEVWLVEELCMVARGWSKTQVAARRAGTECMKLYETLDKK